MAVSFITGYRAHGGDVDDDVAEIKLYTVEPQQAQPEISYRLLVRSGFLPSQFLGGKEVKGLMRERGR